MQYVYPDLSFQNRAGLGPFGKLQLACMPHPPRRPLEVHPLDSAHITMVAIRLMIKLKRELFKSGCRRITLASVIRIGRLFISTKQKQRPAATSAYFTAFAYKPKAFLTASFDIVDLATLRRLRRQSAHKWQYSRNFDQQSWFKKPVTLNPLFSRTYGFLR